MQWMKKIFVLFGVVCSLRAMEQEVSVISLIIDPSKQETFTYKNNEQVVCSAWLCDISPENGNIKFLSSKDGYRFQNKFCINEKRYSYIDLVNAVRRGTVRQYPLYYHKQVYQLPKPVYFQLLLKQQNKYTAINMPKHITEGLLRYLSEDVTKVGGTGFDFCNAITAQFPSKIKKTVRDYGSLTQFIDVRDATVQDKPGDIIMFYKYIQHHNINDVVDERIKVLQPVHYGVALRTDLYLLKLGARGLLYVSTLQSLQKRWRCTHRALVDQAIATRSDFVRDPFKAIVYRDIKLIIYPHNILCDNWGVTTFLHGFDMRHNKVEFRSDIADIEGSQDNVSFSSVNELHTCLIKNLIMEYPFQIHKKLCLQGNELLHMKMVDESNHAQTITFSHMMKKKLLRYLAYDTQDKERNCFDFCRYMCLDFFAQKDMLDESIPFQRACEMVSEKQLVPGDPVMLFYVKNSGEMVITHYAIALDNTSGKTLYISKCGDGGLLTISTMQQMHKGFSSDRF